GGDDINCGVRLLQTSLERDVLKAEGEGFKTLMDTLYHALPCGVAARRSDVRLSRNGMVKVLRKGASWAVEQGWGEEADLEVLEAGGRIEGADVSAVSDRALDRGRVQLGTLGSGNHFCELGYVDEVYDEAKATAFGLRPGQ